MQIFLLYFIVFILMYSIVLIGFFYFFLEEFFSEVYEINYNKEISKILIQM